MDAINLLKRIISKGAVIGKCANLYITDSVKADLFIRECAEQCHRKSAQKLWGKELTKEITSYCGKINFKQE